MSKNIKRYLAAAMLVAIFGFSPAHDCGIYRWDIKTLVDGSGWPLLNKHAASQTIHDLAGLERPEVLGNQRSEPEMSKVTVTAWVIMLGREEDGDYHLVLSNSSGSDQMIAEIPDPTCSKVKKFPGLAEKYKRARQFVDQHIKVPSSQVKPLAHSYKVKITGFVFFDKVAHGNGHAPNGVEIHPVTAISSAQ
jgi:hypothetical protein